MQHCSYSSATCWSVVTHEDAERLQLPGFSFGVTSTAAMQPASCSYRYILLYPADHDPGTIKAK